MPDISTATLAYIEQHRDRHMDLLKALLAIPSVSTDSAHLGEVRRCADWLANYLGSMGMENVRLIPTELGHPVIYADRLQAGPDAPVMLVYGHYDVQPADPYEAWESPPFEATIRNDRLYARGASDMKGQLMAVLIALEAAIMTNGLPVNLKFLLEGQEEIGSRNIRTVIEAEGDLFSADFSLNPDAGMWELDRPGICYGLRGLIDFELNLYGPGKDLHSGMYGGAVHNPAQALCEVIAGLHDGDGAVTLDGFYDRVRQIDEGERETLAELGRDEKFFLDSAGVLSLWGETAFSAFERTVARPTLEVHGLKSGYSGEGTKTIIPSKAMAKVSMRLVPDQDPAEISGLFRAHLERTIPPTVEWELTQFSNSYPALMDVSSYFFKAMEEAQNRTWGTPPVYQLGGGSIGVVAILQHRLGVESILTGYSLPEDNVHSPNEHLHLPTWRKGIDSLVYFLENLRR
jgi:acetylornithine deacetylase/succinyl-diaminopimelate desuccinylase-like protein